MSARRAALGLLGACLGTLAALAPARASVTIESVGLEGHVTGRPGVVPARVSVANPAAQPQTVELTLRAFRSDQDGADTADSFVAGVALGPGERRVLDLPILVAGAGDRVEITARAGGAVVGVAQHTIAREAVVSGQLVALLCADDAACREAQSRVSFAGTDEDRVAKRRALTFVVVREPPAVWWRWEPAWTVVVARALRDVEARGALEGFARHGGRVVLVEDRLADAGFLAAYRGGEPGRPQPIGQGRVARVPSLGSAALDGLFAARMVTGQGEARWASWPYDRSEATWVVRRLARAPVFPSLATVGLALVAYVVVVGVVNFGVLRRRGRPEWAWLTVPALAILFAAAFYAGAARHRPRAFHLDEIALRWMDDRSDVAAIQETLRLSSAGRAAVRLGVPGEAVLTGPRARPEVVQVAALGVQAPTAAWSVRLGPPLAVDLGLAPWSFRDVSVRATRRLPGTVRLDEGVLRNETGEAFTQALVVEPGWVYPLGALPAGAAVELSRAPREPLAQYTGRGWPFPHGLSVDTTGPRGAAEPPPAGAFALNELMRGWPTDGGRAFEVRRALFLGYGPAGTLNSDVTGTPATRAPHVVTVVSLGRR